MAEGSIWNPGDPRNKERTRESQREVRALLMEWDLLGVADAPEASDEYDCMISPLLHQLYAGETAESLHAWITREVRDHFGVRPDATSDRRLAERLVAWWTARTAQ